MNPPRAEARGFLPTGETGFPIKDKTGSFLRKELDDFFNGLDSVAIEEMIGAWRLEYLLTEGTGSALEVFIRNFPVFKLYGKRFLSQDNVKAWIYSFFGIEFSVPLASAVLRKVEFRGKISTAMIYNYLPMIDHFRKVDSDTVMGIMEIQGRVSVYFYLTREK